MSILETPKVEVYAFERDEETKYGFVIKFDEQGRYYKPFLTNSREAIGMFVDPIDFAEVIQDQGSKYTVTPNAIIFDDIDSAAIGAEQLIAELKKMSLSRAESLLFNFARKHYFGMKSQIIQIIADRNDILTDHVSEEELEHEMEILTTFSKGNLTVDGDDGKIYKIEDYDISTGVSIADDGTVFNSVKYDL